MVRPLFRRKRPRTLERTFRKQVVKYLKSLPEVTDVVPMTGVGKGRPDILVEIDGRLHFYLELKGKNTGHDISEDQHAFAAERQVACGFLSPEVDWQQGIQFLITAVREGELEEEETSHSFPVYVD